MVIPGGDFTSLDLNIWVHKMEGTLDFGGLEVSTLSL